MHLVCFVVSISQKCILRISIPILHHSDVRLPVPVSAK